LDFDGLDFSHRYAKVTSQAHAEGFVLDCVWIATNLRLEDVGGGSAVHGAPPPTVRQSCQQQLLLDACQRDSDSGIKAKGDGPQVVDQPGQLVLLKRVGGNGGGVRRGRFVFRLYDYRTRAVATQRPDKAKGVVCAKLKIFSDCSSGLSLRKKPVQERASDPVPEPLRG
jgi:hypothetical protein